METDLPDLVGGRLARRRAELGFSLEELAGRTGVSRAMISRIERRDVHASAVVLDKLCSGLGLSLPDLFAREEGSPLLRRDEQPVWRDQSGYRRREVAPVTTGSPVKISEIEFPPGAEVAFGQSRRRPIDQHVWMLEGEMEVTSSGETHRLLPGDCLHMRLEGGNRFRNVSGKPARYAVILNREPAR